VNVALLGFLNGALVPEAGGNKVAGVEQAVTHLVHVCAEAGVIDPAVDVPLFFFFDGALEPATRGVKVPGIQEATADLVQTRAKARMITGLNIILLLFHDGSPRDACAAAHVEEREALKYAVLLTHHDRFRSSFDLREGVVERPHHAGVARPAES
jgi:hypothetical protein